MPIHMCALLTLIALMYFGAPWQVCWAHQTNNMKGHTPHTHPLILGAPYKDTESAWAQCKHHGAPQNHCTAETASAMLLNIETASKTPCSVP